MQIPGFPVVAAAASLPVWATRSINLADPRIGAKIVSCSDDFFAPAARMLDPSQPVFVPGKYDENGKWMDGWESRRKRVPGHDWCIVELGRPGSFIGVDVDTSFFTGNFPPFASVDGCSAGADPELAASWQPLLHKQPLSGNQHHFWWAPPGVLQTVYSHVRLNIFPDGGVARLRVFGIVSPDAFETGEDGLVDLIALVNGGRAIAWSDAHFGAVANMMLPGRGVDMGDGWETRRKREPGYDWSIIALGSPGRVERIEVDTAHFKGNYPDRVSLQAAYLPDAIDDELAVLGPAWTVVLPEQKVAADSIRTFTDLAEFGAITHVRFNMHPDGGVSRLRLWGKPEAVNAK